MKILMLVITILYYPFFFLYIKNLGEEGFPSWLDPSNSHSSFFVRYIATLILTIAVLAMLAIFGYWLYQIMLSLDMLPPEWQ